MEPSGAVPELLPARMLNEFCYCPRLFFLEWVQARFVDNLDTVEGRYHHRLVDKPAGAAPLPNEGEIAAARSVMLSSQDLGVVSKVDLIEADGGRVRPVDVKRGSPPDNEHRSWEPERVQLCAQALLLREAGYRCDDGILYFAESRTRVVVSFTDELVERTRSLVRGARAVAASDLAPAPLVASSKCPRCSLVGICLPDEVNALSARSSLPPRRLVPTDGAARPLYVTEQGASVGVKSGRVEVRLEGEILASLRLLDVSQVCLIGNAQVTSQAMREFFFREIPVAWFTYGGQFCGLAEGLPSKHVDLRRRQVAIAHQGGLEIAQRLVAAKIRNSRTLLRRNTRARNPRALQSLKQLAAEALESVSIASLLGIEGTAARIYFGEFPTMLAGPHAMPGAPFSFEGRNRRPPRDAVNCLLSFTYALLTKDLTAALWLVGFDPYLGFFHRPRFGRPALALDMAEEFRPLVAESVVIGLINNGEIRPSDFVVRAGGVSLTSEGRRTVLRAYERRLGMEVRHPTFGYSATYRRVFEVQARVLAAHILAEVPEYSAFMTR
jgi:CRISPR-associated protein Cas1